MTDFLKLAAIPIPVAIDTADMQRREIGGRGEAFDGSARSSVRGEKLEFPGLKTPLLAKATAIALAALIRGLGHVVSFNVNTTSSRGTLATAVTNASRTTSTPTPKFGAGQLNVGATTGTISWDVQGGSSWTVIVWRYNGATWDHWVIAHEGFSDYKYTNGVSVGGAASTPWLTVTGGVVTLSNSTGSAVQYDDLVILPYVVPATWPALLYAANAAWPALPDLNATGDMLDADLTMVGVVSGGPRTSAVIDGVWCVDATSLEFSLREV